MKTKEQKYNEAVERNLSKSAKKKKYKGMKLSEAKMSIGIRAKDDRFDNEVNVIIKG